MSFSNHRMCIPGDNRINVLGLYSVQMMRKAGTAFSPVLERERGRESGEGSILATALKTNKHRVLSMYSVHRINPQCVLTNITQLPPDWLVSIGEAWSATPTPPPHRSPPTGTETAAPTRCRSVSGRIHIPMQ